MRLTIGVLLTALLTPLAHAELIDEVNDRNELRIAISADSSTNIRKQGQWTGFEIGLGQALAKELDVGVEFVPVDHDELLDGVESGRYDIALDQITASPELKQRLGVSEPYTDGDDDRRYVMPFQKDNPAFEKALNAALQRIKDNGRMTELAQQAARPAVEPQAQTHTEAADAAVDTDAP
ncbi:transporter substrate-binding domain-containing protein [Pseudomonas qingdaonensis]|uniref:Transporter substrate-binding domain-containing protein n=1 Tax=Pseudomonas qingdaonensis TaxID=2056231 RepID=A0ABX8DQZ7_9PSED|nr:MULTISPECIES: transporter substrate-binding domain-containing protein [Pseudomonas]QVL18725.1 transporter substrate-binding domain-containing protein [Pseudomonas qingdaonensis]WEJ21463.1 transporter substrate-binding domain-containing protein [Pseudomonas sp. SD17-1]